MSSLQQRLAAVADMLAVIAAIAVSLKYQLLEGLRERVRKASEIAGPETRSVTATIPGPIWKAATKLLAAGV
jgi:hypothetical protein